jgi:UDP-N-acetylglucosamine--N-acetylmuramyl-(pentapeptide) pyrophosphoryl-undecaprenol N-acetylglucosamine transferase
LKRVYLGIFGSGLGHASRLMAVSKRLTRQGCSLQFSSSGESRDYILRQGFACNEIPLVDVVFTDTGIFSAKETLKVAPLLFVKVFQQVGVEARNMVRFKPDVVLSDSLVSTVMASKLLGLRCVTVLNQLKLLSSPRTPQVAAKLLTNGSITVGNEFWELSDRILFPDLPPPYTISESNLSGMGSAGSRAEFIGFLTPPRSYPEDLTSAEIMRSPKKMIFWQVSGPEKTRVSLLPKIMKLASGIREDFLSVISAGDPTGDGVPKPFDGGYLYDWCPTRDAFIDRCDVFVSRAGHVTISDLILRGKPSVLVPIPGQMEQIGNAAKAERLGVAARIDEEDLSESSLREAAVKLSSEETRKSTQRLMEYARAFDAEASVVSALGV